MIDDGSTDATAERAAAAGAAVVSAPVQPRDRRRGPDRLQVSRSRTATRSSSGSTATASTTRTEIPNLLAPLERGEADVVVGSRFATGDANYKPAFARRAGIRWFAGLVSLLTGQKLTDTTSGFQARQRRAIRLFAADYPHDYPEVEAAVMVVTAPAAHRRGPGPDARPRDGRSSITALRSLYYAVKVTLALFVGMFRRRVVPVEER